MLRFGFTRHIQSCGRPDVCTELRAAITAEFGARRVETAARWTRQRQRRPAFRAEALALRNIRPAARAFHATPNPPKMDSVSHRRLIQLSFRTSTFEAAVSRLGWTSRSSTSPSRSTARHRYMRRSWIETTISSKCQVPDGLGRSRRRLRANMGPSFRTQRRTISWEVSIPRSARSSRHRGSST
jgi:hypothetical protein